MQSSYKLRLGDGSVISALIDDYSDPWKSAQTVLLIHGLAECGEAWYGWVPHLAGRYRVLRPDLRGFGRSTPMPKDFNWSLDLLADDLALLLRSLEVGTAHVVGAKIGATISVRFATRHPSLVSTLTVVGLPIKGSTNRPGLDPNLYGVRAWARSSMEERLGSDASREMLEWWSDMMGGTDPSTFSGFSNAVGSFDVGRDLDLLQCPVLAIASHSERHPVSETEVWRRKLARSEIFVVPGDGYHAAAVSPGLCAKATCDFISRFSA